MSTLKASQLSFAYEQGFSLKDFSYSFSAKRYAILGPSGSGKSTLLRLLSGLLSPQSGCLTLDDILLAAVPLAQRNFGFVSQENKNAYPHLSVYENLLFALKQCPSSPEEKELLVQRFLTSFCLAPYATFRPVYLSEGERTLLAVARALIKKPGLLFLDEPFSALDKERKNKLIAYLKRYQQRYGTTILFTTHDLEEASLLADEALFLENGSLTQSGLWNEAAPYPKTFSAADFLFRDLWPLPGLITQDPNGTFFCAGNWHLSLSEANHPTTVASLAFHKAQFALQRHNDHEFALSFLFEAASNDEQARPVWRLRGANNERITVPALDGEIRCPGQMLTLYYDERNLLFFDKTGVLISSLISSSEAK